MMDFCHKNHSLVLDTFIHAVSIDIPVLILKKRRKNDNETNINDM